MASLSCLAMRDVAVLKKCSARTALSSEEEGTRWAQDDLCTRNNSPHATTHLSSEFNNCIEGTFIHFIAVMPEEIEVSP